MPFVDDIAGGFSAPTALPAERPTPSFSETAGSAFRLENDVFAAYELLQPKTEYPPDANFNITKKLQTWDQENRTDMFENYRNNFLGVRSDAEFNHVMGKIRQEQKDKENLALSGATGVVLSIAAGTLSPTIFLPFIGQERGLAAVAKGAALVGGSAALQEIPLQLTQETRTAEDSFFSIAAGTVVGGLLGGAVGVLRKGEREALEVALTKDADMVRSNFGQAIPGSLGAASTPAEGAGRLKNPGLSKVADWLGPVTRVINQDTNKTMSWAMSQLADAGLRLEGNAAGKGTNVGGAVEARIKTYDGQYAQAIEALDDNFAKHVFGENPVPTLFSKTRAYLAGGREGKLSQAEFNTEVSRALRNGDVHEIPEVAAAAKTVREKVFDPVLKEAVAVGIYKDVKVLGDQTYLTRLFDHDVINANTNEFIETLARNFAEQLNEEFGKKLSAFEKTAGREKQLIEDLVRPKEEVDSLQEELKAKLEALNSGRNADLIATEDQIALLRRQAKRAAAAGDEEGRKAALADARQLRRANAELLDPLRETRGELRSRLNALSRAAVVLEERQAKKLALIEKIEQQSENSMRQVAKAGQRFLNRLEKFTDKELDKELKSLSDDFTDIGNRLDKTDERIGQLLQGEQPELQKLLAQEELQVPRREKLTALTDEIEALQSVDRAELRGIVEAKLAKVEERVQALIEKRFLREQRLREAAANLDPKQVAKRIGELGEKGKARRVEFIEKLREGGADNVDFNARTADFTEYAKARATEIKDKIQGTNVRSPVHEIMAGPRGAELARVLNIESGKIEKFLENDIEKVLKTYIRTLAPDIEIKKKFGDINGTQMFLDATNELNDKLEQLSALAKEKKWTPEKLQKETNKLNAEFKELHRDLETVIGRLRATHGLPKNPDGMAYRMGRMVTQINVLRMMGGTLISSIPDIARPIQRHGLIRTFRDGFAPLVSDWQRLSLTAREARLAGAGLGAITHSRSQALHDIMDNYGRRSKFERGVEFAANKMGRVALFDQWTEAMQQISSSVIITKITDSLDIVHGGAKASAREVAEAQEFLASKGLVNGYDTKIWQELNSAEGGTRHNGVLLPNTESWTSEEAKRAFRSALVSEVDNTIIIPGVERPTWMTETMPGKLLGQFKSFGMSSTHKVLLSGLQQRDMAFVNGTIVSLAMGALSYYIASIAAGGKTEEKMRKADLGKFADEAIARSGTLGIFSDAQRFFERIPATQPYVSFSGERTSRRGGDDIVDVLGGPALGGLKNLSKVLTGIDEPTRNTLHNARLLLPWQNLIAFRRGLDAIEEASGLPERRN